MVESCVETSATAWQAQSFGARPPGRPGKRQRQEEHPSCASGFQTRGALPVRFEAPVRVDSCLDFLGTPRYLWRKAPETSCSKRLRRMQDD